MIGFAGSPPPDGRMRHPVTVCQRARARAPQRVAEATTVLEADEFRRELEALRARMRRDDATPWWARLLRTLLKAPRR